VKRVPLEELLEQIIDHRGKTPKKLGTDFTLSGVPVASAQLVTGGVLDLTDARCVDEGTWRRWMPVPLEEGDVLLTSEAPLGRVAWVKDGAPLVLGQRLFALRAAKNVTDSRYLGYWLSSAEGQASLGAHATGSTVSGIRQSALRKVQVPVRDLDAQRAIGEVLGALDDKIAANRAAAHAARDLAVAVVSTSSNLVKLGDVVRIVRKSMNPSALDLEVVKHFSLPAFDAGAATIDSPSSIKSTKNLLQEPVVLVSKLNPRIPRIWAVDRLPAELVLASTEFIALAPIGIGIGAVWASLLDPRFTQSVLERTAGTTGSHQRVKPEQMLDIEVRDVRELAVEQRELVESLCRKVNAVADEKQLLASTRDELLPLLMSGRITIKDAEKTVEEVV